MFSLTTLPVHCCSTVFTVVTSLTSPTLVTLLAKQTHISQYYCWYVSLQCYETDTEVLWSPLHTAMLQEDVLAKSLDKQTIWNYLQYYCLFNLTPPWCWELWRNVITLRLRSLVWRRIVRQTRHKIPTDRNWKRTRYGAGAICIDSSTGIRGVK